MTITDEWIKKMWHIHTKEGNPGICYNMHYVLSNTQVKTLSNTEFQVT